jgi:hypothetical protein
MLSLPANLRLSKSFYWSFPSITIRLPYPLVSSVFAGDENLAYGFSTGPCCFWGLTHPLTGSWLTLVSFFLKISSKAIIRSFFSSMGSSCLLYLLNIAFLSLRLSSLLLEVRLAWDSANNSILRCYSAFSYSARSSARIPSLMDSSSEY